MAEYYGFIPFPRMIVKIFTYPYHIIFFLFIKIFNTGIKTGMNSDKIISFEIQFQAVKKCFMRFRYDEFI